MRINKINSAFSCKINSNQELTKIGKGVSFQGKFVKLRLCSKHAPFYQAQQVYWELGLRKVKEVTAGGERIGWDAVLDNKFDHWCFGKDKSSAIEIAIRNSDHYVADSRVAENNMGNLQLDYNAPSYATYFNGQVYFTDKNEKVGSDILKKAVYVVYAPGASKIEPPKKSWLERLFD